MRNILFILILSLIGCTKPQEIKQLPPVRSNPDKIIVHERKNNKIEDQEFSIVLPNSLERIDVDEDNVKLLYQDDLTQTILVLTSESSGLSLDDLGSNALDSLREIGAFVSKIEEIKINDQLFIHVEAVHKERFMHAWFTNKNNKSYSLSCGFRKSKHQDKICNSIIKTFKIK